MILVWIIPLGLTRRLFDFMIIRGVLSDMILMILYTQYNNLSRSLTLLGMRL